MRPTSDTFRASLRHAHVVASECRLQFPAGGAPVVVPVEGGAVTIDRTAQIRRTGSVQIPWSLRTGLDLGLDLRTLPLGGYCELRRGLRYADGTTELVPLGPLRVESVTWRTTDEVASLELADRMAQVRDEPFLAPFVPEVLPSITRNGTLNDNSPVVTGLAMTSDLVVGMSVTALGVLPGTRIKTIDSATQITLTAPANIVALKSAILHHDSFNFEVETTADLFVGMKLSSSGHFNPATDLLTAIQSNTVCVSNRWLPGDDNLAAEVLLTLDAVQSITFGGTVRIADVAIAMVYEVFGDRIAYQKLVDPIIALVDAAYTGNRADALQALALAAGAEAYFDATGAFVFGPHPGDTPPVWTIDAGMTGVMVGADESLNRTGVYNGVLVEGQNAATDAPVSALVTDNDPASPTRWAGPFGKVARIEQSSAVQTVEQAQEAAQELLDKRLTLVRALTVTSAPNPALEASDVVAVLFPDGRQESHIVDSVRIALGPTEAQVFALRSTSGEMPAPSRGVYHNAAAWRQLEPATPADEGLVPA